MPAVAASAAAAAALLRRPAPPRPGPLGRLWVAALAAFAGWTALALLWTDSVPRTVLELERVLLYVVVAGALVVLATRRSAVAVGAGAVAGAAAVSLWNLGVRVAGPGPGRGEVARPLGYENGLAALAALGALLACALALHLSARRLRALALAPLAIFVPELALASSTGAWVALGAGAAAAAALRLRAPAVWAAAAAVVLAGVLAVGVAAGRGNPRAAYWRAAWDEHRAAAWLGTGPGTYAQAWLRYRENDRTTADAHSLYLETLGESGPIGLALLGAALLVPLAAAAGSGRDPLVAGAAGAYVAFLVHAAVDFDWELPAVTAAGLAAGAIVLVRAHPVVSLPLGRAARTAGVAAAVSVAGFSILTLVGNRAVAASGDALGRGDVESSIADARRAASWLPWDSRPWELVGLARLLAAGDRRAAATSFRRAIRLDRHEAGLWFELAAAAGGDEGRRARAEARRLDPRSQGG